VGVVLGVGVVAGTGTTPPAGRGVVERGVIAELEVAAGGSGSGVSPGERGGGVEREREREREIEGWGSLVIHLSHLKRERESTHTYTHITHQSANLTQTCITHQGHMDRHDWHQDVIHHR
jgi:hypothetical protein